MCWLPFVIGHLLAIFEWIMAQLAGLNRHREVLCYDEIGLCS